MALFPESMDSVIFLLTRPLYLFMLPWIFGFRIICLIIRTWMELGMAAFFFHLSIFRRIMSWAFAFISFPLRVLNALQRERLLELCVFELQIELENLDWDKRELEAHVRRARKEYRMLELILSEYEEDHDKAIVKIELLESQLQDLKNENIQLKEILGKGLWGIKEQDDTGNESWKSSYDGTDFVLQELMMQSAAWESTGKSKSELANFLNTRRKAMGSFQAFTPAIISSHSKINKVLDQQRSAVRLRSLFSAVLSVLVGIIIWKATEPCMPLVVALFTVAGLSLKSVVQFFSTIKNKSAYDGAILLSVNWFILGTLTYPTLPTVAQMLAPCALRIVNWTSSWFSFSS